MKMPNFFIIGSAKAGTSSLYHYLKQHPQIYMSPVKEPRFFAFEGEEPVFCGPSTNHDRKFAVNTLEEYRQLFEGVTDEIAIGEASPVYMHIPKAAQRIKQYVPEAKIIAILRHPAERAFSAFSHLVREGYETLSFEEALQQERERIERQWIPLFYYEELGFYHRQLQHYFELFEREQIRIYLYEELAANSSQVVGDIYEFLGVDSNFEPNLSQRKNVSGIPKSRFLYDLFTKDNAIKSVFKPLLSNQIRRKFYNIVTTKTLKPKPKLATATKSNLIQIYREDILRLQDLIDRDLSPWLSVN